MGTLKLVPVDLFGDLISDLSSLLFDHMEITEARYGVTGHRMVYVNNTDNGAEMRIIFDPDKEFDHRQGMHVINQCGDSLAEHLERGFDQGFDTIWVHS